ncbi:MAG: RDD family protein [Candidatus Izemoplasmataceae bacterium]
MQLKKHMPAQFNDRIAGFSLEMMVIFFSLLVIIFNAWPLWFNSVIVISSFYLVTFIPMVFTPGQSLGKKLSKVIILDEDYQPISLKKAHLREFAKWVFGFLTLGIYFIVAFWMFMKRLDRRTPHDFLFKTQVVYSEDLEL